MLLYVPPHRTWQVRQAMAAAGLSELTFDFDTAGAQVLSDREPLDPPKRRLILRHSPSQESFPRRTPVYPDEEIAVARTD